MKKKKTVIVMLNVEYYATVAGYTAKGKPLFELHEEKPTDPTAEVVVFKRISKNRKDAATNHSNPLYEEKKDWEITYYNNKDGYVGTYRLEGITEVDAITYIVKDLENRPEVHNYSLNEDDGKDHDY